MTTTTVTDQILTMLGPLEAHLPAATAAVTATGRERDRLSALRRTATHVLSLPAAAPSPGDLREQDLLLRSAGLRRQAAWTLGQLGQHAAAEMPAALERAIVHWDQAGNLTLLSQQGRHDAQAVQAAAQEALDLVDGAAYRTPAALALLLAVAESITALDAACTLLRAVEIGFVNLLRDRLRAHDAVLPAGQRQALLPDGQPFIDPGEALLAVARSFGWEPDAAAQAA